MVSEYINIHVGGAGVQIGKQCWELYCLEHGIQPDGQMSSDRAIAGGDDSFQAFFDETEAGRFVPRAIFADTDLPAIDDIRTGSYCELFFPDQLQTEKGDNCGGIYSRGRYTTGRAHIDKMCDQIRKQCERCSSLQGFLISHSLAGGTGSGLTSLLIQKLRFNFGYKNSRLQFCVYHGPSTSTTVVEPYNAVFFTHDTMDYSDGSFLFDNETLYDICCRNLGIEMPTYDNMNRLIARVVSSITAGNRFSSSQNFGLREVQNKLMPYPRVHFPLVTYFPIMSGKNGKETDVSVSEITNAAFDSQNKLIKCDPTLGKYIASCLLLRGDVILKDVNAAIESIQANRNLQFVDGQPADFKLRVEYTPRESDRPVVQWARYHWIPKNPNDLVKAVVVKRPLKFRAALTADFHVGLTSQPAAATPDGDLGTAHKEACKLDNTTAIGQVWGRLNRKFKLMFDKRAFVHWFVGEGSWEHELAEAQDDLIALENVYKELARLG